MTTFNAKIGIFAHDGTSGAFRSVAMNAKGLVTKLGAASAGAKQMGQSMMGASIATALAMKSSFNELVAVDDAMADLRKVVDASPEKLRDMTTEFQKMGPLLGLTAEGMIDIAAAAGQSGIEFKEIGGANGWAAMVAKSAVAFDMVAGETGTALAKIRTQLGMTTGQTADYAGTINELSNTSASTAPDLINFARRIAADGKVAGFANKETLAFGSAMVASGAGADVAATSFRNMAKALQKGGTATKRQREGYKALGLDAKKVSMSMQKDAVKTTQEVLKRIAKLAPHLRKSATSQIFGDEARALMPLINQLKLLDDALETATGSNANFGSTQKEWANRMKTISKQLGIGMGKIKHASADFARALVPTVMAIADGVGRLADSFRALTPATQTYIATAATVVAASGPVLWVLGSMGTTAVTAAKGVIMLNGALMGGVGKIGAFISGVRKMAQVLTVVTALSGGVSFAGLVAGFSAVGAAVLAATWPIALMVAGVTAIAYAAFKISQNWEPIKAFFSDLWGSISEGAQNAISFVGQFSSELLTSFMDLNAKVFGVVGDFGMKLVHMIIPPETLQSIVGKVSEIGAAIKSTISDAFTGVADWVSGVFGGIFTGIKSEMAEFVKWLTKWLPDSINPFSGGGGDSKTNPVQTARAVAATASHPYPASAGAGSPANVTATQNLQQPQAEVLGPELTGVEANLSSVVTQITALVGQVSNFAQQKYDGVVTSNISVKVSGGQITGNQSTAGGVARVGNVGVQELGTQ